MARTAVVPVRLSNDEREHLYAQAKPFGLSLSEYIRRAALKRRVGVAVVADVNRDAYRELCRIGNNLNQLAKAMNEGRASPLDERLLAELRAAVKTIGLQVLGAQGGTVGDEDPEDETE